MRRAFSGARRFSGSHGHFSSCQRQPLPATQLPATPLIHLLRLSERRARRAANRRAAPPLARHTWRLRRRPRAAARAPRRRARSWPGVGNPRARARRIGGSGGGSRNCHRGRNSEQGIAAVTAAAAASSRATDLPPAMCADPASLQLQAAKLADAGASVDCFRRRRIWTPTSSASSSPCVRGRSGRRADGASARAARPPRTKRALELAKFAHEELGLLHFMACLASAPGAAAVGAIEGARSCAPGRRLRKADAGRARAGRGVVSGSDESLLPHQTFRTMALRMRRRAARPSGTPTGLDERGQTRWRRRRRGARENGRPATLARGGGDSCIRTAAVSSFAAAARRRRRSFRDVPFQAARSAALQ